MLGRMSRSRLAALLLTATLVGCGGSGTGDGDSGPTVTGTVTYLARIAMPPNATIEVTVSDISSSGAQVLLGKQTIDEPGAVPVPYSVTYDPADVVETDTYAVKATILRDGHPWMANIDVVPVITDGNPTTDVEVVVKMVGD
jgi:uncharacterized lipoprotein YbaY